MNDGEETNMRNQGTIRRDREAVRRGTDSVSLYSFSTIEMPDAGFASMNRGVTEVPVADVTIPDAVAFVTYWESLRDGRLAPSWRQFDLLALGTDPVSRMMVVDVLNSPLRFKYRFWGTANIKVKGVEMTGRLVDDFPGCRAKIAAEEYRRVFSEKRPMAFFDRLVLPSSIENRISAKAAFDQINLRLPLSDDGNQISHVISLANWKRHSPS